MLLYKFNVIGIQLDFAAAGGDSGIIVAAQVKQLRRIMVLVVDY